jgi:type VI secretion system protein ImpA
MQIDKSLEELLKPISEQQPCGVPIRYEPEYDALREARREEDASLPSGVWQADIKRADWGKVQQLASTVLRTRSKDLVVASWLGEAWLHLEGLAGLTRALALLALLGERFSEGLHPIPESPENGDAAYRAGPLQWLAQRYAETLRIQVPLLPGIQPALTLDGWHRLHSRLLSVESSGSKAKPEQVSLQQQLKQFQAAADSLPEPRAREGLQDISQSRDWLARLDDWCNQSLAEEAPSFKPMLEALQQMETILLGLLAQRPPSASLQLQPIADAVTNTTADSVANLAEEPVVATSQTSDETQSRGAMLPPLASREQAYQALQLVADYLSAIEPHSPVPYFLRQAIDWGRKPLPELLSELIEADDNARRLWKQLGVLS